MKATHEGTCQICLSRQKLPNGRMAKHGYTTTYGFFNGVCMGSGHLPLQQSCELALEVADRLNDAANRTREFAAKVRSEEGTGCWVMFYDRFTFKSSWQRAEAKVTEDGIRAFLTDGDKAGRPHTSPSQNSIFPKTAEELAAAYNERKAIETMGEAKRMDEDADALRRRAVVWQPAELLPLR